MKRKMWLMLTGLIAMIILLAGCGGADKAGYDSIDDFEGQKVGVVTGMIHAGFLQELLEDPQIEYFNSSADAIAAVKAGKIAGFCCDDIVLTYIDKEDSKVSLYTSDVVAATNSIVFEKTDEGEAWAEEFNAFLEGIKEDGTYDQLIDKWLYGKDVDIDIPESDGSAGVFKIGYDGGVPPLDYYEGDVHTGLEVDLVDLFCSEYGYEADYIMISTDGLLPALATGKCNAALGGFSYTEERAKTMIFSDPYYSSKIAFLYEGEDSDRGFISKICSSFKQNFITKDRWKLFVSGIGTTLTITLLALIIGTALGFGLFLLCMTGSRIVTGVKDIYVWIMHRMPIVVFLMVMFYIVFRDSSISGTAVAVTCFGIAFGASVVSILDISVKAVPKGQTEAGLALGYTKLKTMFRVVLPQAAMFFMPKYRDEIVTLIKGTAVVGYVAVQDITKMSDIIRSQTFDAFMPLLASAIVYIILAEVLIILTGIIEKKLSENMKEPENYLKGVKTDDRI